MAINFAGYVFKDNGAAVSGADVYLKQVSDGVTEASTTTDSNGYWAFSESDEDRYYVEIAQGSSKRFIRWADEISLKEIDVRNNEANTTPAATFTNLTNNASNQVAVFSGANTTRADNDEIYMSFKLADSAGNIDEFARMTVVATDVTATEEDAQIEFDVMKSGNLTKVWTITSSTAGAMSFDMNVDSLTIGSGADTDISLTFDANTSDGVITWMEDEDYFQFSDDILMSTTERINLRDTAIYIYSSTDGQLDLVADTEIQIAATTIDINGAVAFDGALTGITNITLSGTLSDGNYTFDTSGNVSGLGTVSSGTITTSGNIELGHASDTTLARSGSGDVTIEGNAIYRAGGTDVPVADGGTGASSLTDGGVLLGSGTSAVTAMAVLADSEMIVGDGTTDPVAESGATLRTSIGVGTGDSPQFTDLTLTDDLILNSDSAVISLGDGNDATLTHDGTTGLTIGGNPIIVDSGGQIELDSASGILTFEDGGTEVLRFTEGNSGDVTIKLVTNGKDLIFTDNGDATNMKILDAAAGINVPGEVQTTGIGYTDGDNAMTIADGGAVTFPVSIDVTGSAGIILENDETITNSTNGYVALSGSLTIPNAGTIGSAGDADSIAIASDGVVTMNQIPVFSAGINVSGGTIAGTIATATQNSITTMTGLVTTGTIGTGVWQGTAIASAYLDSDTAHLSGTQTFTGAKTFTSTVTVGANTDGHDVKLFGNSSGSYMLWDESEDDLILKAANLVIGHTAPMLPAGATPVYNQVGTDQNTSSWGITRFSANTGGPQIFLTKSHSNSIGTYKFPTGHETDINTYTNAGSIHWQSGDDVGDDLAIEAAKIGVTYRATSVEENEATTSMEFYTAESSGAAERMRINQYGQVLIGQTALPRDGGMGTKPGLIINQGTGDGPALALSSDDVDHGMDEATFGYDTDHDNFAVFEKASPTVGGLLIKALGEDAANSRNMRIDSVGGTADTGKGNTAAGLIDFYVAEQDGSDGLANVTANGNIFAIRTLSAGSHLTRFMIDEDGDVYSPSTNAHIAFSDSYDDAQLIRAFDHAKSSSGAEGMVRDKWDDFVKYNEKDLVEAGVLGDTLENGGLLNTSALQRLHNGAIWQGYVKQKEMQERIHTLESRLLALESK